MPCAHPFLDIDNVLDFTRLSLNFVGHFCVGVWLFRAFQVASEVLQESDFLLKLLREFRERKLTANVLSIRTATLHIVKVEAIRVKADFSRVVEEDTCGFIAQAVAETILRRVVNPLLHPDLVVTLSRLSTWVHVLSSAEAGRCGTIGASCVTAAYLVTLPDWGSLGLACSACGPRRTRRRR